MAAPQPTPLDKVDHFYSYRYTCRVLKTEQVGGMRARSAAAVRRALASLAVDRAVVVRQIGE